MLLCDYCGDEISTDIPAVKGRLHEKCHDESIPRCKQAVSKFLKYASIDGRVLSMGIHVSYIYGAKQEKDKQKKKRKREHKLNELSKQVSALRNSNSGSILIHLVGLAKGDQFIGSFNEFADIKLYELIHDSKSFQDVYRKQRLSDHEECQDFHDFLVLFVSAASTLTTADFKTRIALDDSIKDPSPGELRTFLRQRKLYNETFHALPGIVSSSDVANLQESSSIQFKSHFAVKENDSEVVDCIVHKHRLTEYVSAFCKLEGGGSYLYGVHEKTVIHGTCDYNSKETIPQPVIITDQNNFKDTLAQRIRENILVCDYDGRASTDADVAQVRFIPSKTNVDKNDTTSSLKRKHADAKEASVVHVSVRPVTGIVFYDKQGPLAYRYDANTNDVTRMNVKEWFRAFTRTKAQDTSTQTSTGNTSEGKCMSINSYTQNIPLPDNSIPAVVLAENPAILLLTERT